MMIRKKHIRAMLLGTLFATMLPLSGMGWHGVQNHNATQPSAAGQESADSLDLEQILREESQNSRKAFAGIALLARSYGDSVVLRWAAEDYATQKELDEKGVIVLRYDYKPVGDDPMYDTLAIIKPTSEEAMRARYHESDSVAMMALGLLHGDAGLHPDQTKSAPGTLGALMELYQDQQMKLAMRILVSEWRKDIANSLGMRFVDKKVRIGHEYEYIVRPLFEDSLASMPIASAVQRVENKIYRKDKFELQMGDSLVGHGRVRLWWQNKGISSFEIDRRRVGEEEWTRVNSMPYWNLTPLGANGSLDERFDCAYEDTVGQIGDYEYRIFGHDPFGELTNPSQTYRVHFRDMEAPIAPELTLVEIDRQDPTDLGKKVMATFHFRKEKLEEDFVGFMPLYYNERMTGKEWKSLSREMLPPGDSTFTCDVTGLSTGMVMVAAYDSASNVSYSMPRMVQIVDVKAPSMMKNFQAKANLEDGTIHLTWEPDSVDDDIEYYEVLVANDTTHTFAQLTQGKYTRTEYTDTVAMDVNQKYIYYKVRAVDYSTNLGVETPALQVLRPSRARPNVAHLLTSKVDSAGIFMEWACSNEQMMDRHILMRRLEGTEKWDTLGIFRADSVKLAGDVVRYRDLPPYVRNKEYQYAMESFTCWDVSSGLSLIFCTYYEGPRLMNIPIQLKGVYDKDADETILTWEVNNGKPLSGDWYLCLFRKGPSDEYASFYLSLPATTTERRSSMLNPGQEEEYYIKVKYRDGRESRSSNRVTVRATERN